MKEHMIMNERIHDNEHNIPHEWRNEGIHGN